MGPEFGIVAAAAGRAGAQAPVEAAACERHLAADGHVRARADIPDRRASIPEIEKTPGEGNRLQPHAPEAEIVLKTDLSLGFERLRQHEAADDADLWPVEVPEKGVDPPRLRSHVVVDIDDDIARGRAQTGVAGVVDPPSRLDNVVGQVAAEGAQLDL